MLVAITSNGADRDSAVDPLFGRCAHYVFVETDTGELSARPNPAAGAASGAGILAAQFIIGHGAQALLTGNVGPNAMDVFQASDVAVYGLPDASMTVDEAIRAFEAGQLTPIQGATVGAHRAGPAQAERIAALTTRARDLRQELATILDEIEQLEKEK